MLAGWPLPCSCAPRTPPRAASACGRCRAPPAACVIGGRHPSASLAPSPLCSSPHSLPHPRSSATHRVRPATRPPPRRCRRSRGAPWSRRRCRGSSQSRPPRGVWWLAWRSPPSRRRPPPTRPPQQCRRCGRVPVAAKTAAAAAAGGGSPSAALWRLAISGGAGCAGTSGDATAAAGASGAGGVGGASGPVFVDEPAGGPPVVAVPGPLPTPTPTATTTLTGRHIVVLVDSTLRLLLVHSQVPHGSCSASTISWARACRKGSRCCGGRRSSRGHHVAARYGGGRVSVRGRAAWTNWATSRGPTLPPCTSQRPPREAAVV